MKQVISDYERSILRAVACAAVDLRIAQQSLVTTIERLLLVDATEVDATRSIEVFVNSVPDVGVEVLLHEMGVAVHDPLAPEES